MTEYLREAKVATGERLIAAVVYDLVLHVQMMDDGDTPEGLKPFRELNILEAVIQYCDDLKARYEGVMRVVDEGQKEGGKD